MTQPRQWTIAIGVVMALVFGTALVIKIRPQIDLLGVGSGAPDFHAMNLRTRRPTTLADYRGKVVLLNVWATWCLPCRVEMPSIELLNKAYASKGLKILAVSVDDPGTDATIRAFVKQYGLSFEVLHDPRGNISELYDISGYPETFIVGKDGVIRKKLMSATDWNSPEARSLVDRLLAERID